MVNNQEINQPAAIKIENVSVYLGDVRVLENISFTIEHGVMVALVGPNGAGKSTLFRAILGLVPIAGGEILIHGLPFSEIRGEMAYVPQSEQINWLFPLTSLDVVMLDLCCCLNKHICAFGKPDEAFTPEVLEELYGSHSSMKLDSDGG